MMHLIIIRANIRHYTNNPHPQAGIIYYNVTKVKQLETKVNSHMVNVLIRVSS